MTKQPIMYLTNELIAYLLFVKAQNQAFILSSFVSLNYFPRCFFPIAPKALAFQLSQKVIRRKIMVHFCLMEAEEIICNYAFPSFFLQFWPTSSKEILLSHINHQELLQHFTCSHPIGKFLHFIPGLHFFIKSALNPVFNTT